MACSPQEIRWNRIAYRRLRANALNKLGAKCVQCGIADRDVLTVDHINNTELGKSITIERAEHKKKDIYRGYLIQRTYRRIVSGEVGTDEVQVLCANCHLKKSKEDHKRFRVENRTDHWQKAFNYQLDAEIITNQRKLF